MTASAKRAFWRTMALLMLGSVLQYALFHAANLLGFSKVGVILSYATYFFDRIWEFFFPALSALMMLIAFSYNGCKSALLNGVAYASARALYYIPLGYMMAISGGYDSLESLLGGLLIAILMIAVAYVEAVICLLLSLIPAYFSARKAKTAVAEVALCGLKQHDALDISSVGTAAVGITVLVQFLKLLATEVRDTVEFFAGGSFYDAGEIFYIVFKYCFAIMLLAGMHFLLCFIKRKTVTARECEIKNTAKAEKGDK